MLQWIYKPKINKIIKMITYKKIMNQYTRKTQVVPHKVINCPTRVTALN